MPYTPTLADTPAPRGTPSDTGPYIPTLADTPRPGDMPPPTHTGALAQTAAVPLAALSGIAEGTRQIANLGAAGVNYITRELGIGDVLPHLHKASFTHALRLPQDRPIEAIGETIPALVGADISAPISGLSELAEDVPFLTRGMATQAAGGGLYGAGQAASQGQSVVKGGLEGTGIGLAGGAAGEALGAAGRPVGRFISREIVSPLAEKAGTLISKGFPSNNALQSLGAALNNARTMAGRWTPDLNKSALEADHAQSFSPLGVYSSKKQTFDNSDYKKAGHAIINELKKKAENNPDFYSPLVKEVQRKMDSAPTSYEGTLWHNASLNEMPTTWEHTNVGQTKALRGISSKLKNGLHEQAIKNASDNPAGQDFLNRWMNHRKNYQFLKSFEQTPVSSKAGKITLKYNKPQAEALSGDMPVTGSLKHFLPSGKDGDTLKMEHLGNLLGNQELARQALKEEYLRPAYDDSEDMVNPTKLLTKYKNLSSKQKAYFFSPEERTLLDSASKAKGAAKTVALRHIGARYGTPIGLGAVGGGLVGEHEGEGWGKGALLGAGLGAGVSLLPRAFVSPRGAALAAQLAKKGIPSRGISYPLTSSALSFTQ